MPTVVHYPNARAVASFVALAADSREIAPIPGNAVESRLPLLFPDKNNNKIFNSKIEGQIPREIFDRCAFPPPSPSFPRVTYPVPG